MAVAAEQESIAAVAPACRRQALRASSSRAERRDGLPPDEALSISMAYTNPDRSAPNRRPDDEGPAGRVFGKIEGEMRASPLSSSSATMRVASTLGFQAPPQAVSLFLANTGWRLLRFGQAEDVPAQNAYFLIGQA